MILNLPLKTVLKPRTSLSVFLTAARSVSCLCFSFVSRLYGVCQGERRLWLLSPVKVHGSALFLYFYAVVGALKVLLHSSEKLTVHSSYAMIKKHQNLYEESQQHGRFLP